MADNTVIVDEKASTDGVIPVWARENTLQSIAAQSKSSTAYLKGMAQAALNKKDFEDLNKELESTLKDGTKSNILGFRTLGTGIGKNFNTLQGSLSNSFKTMAGELSSLSKTGIVSLLENHALTTGKSLLSMGEKAGIVSGSLLKLTGAFVGFAGVAAGVYMLAEEMVEDFQKMYENGINFTEGLVGMTKAAGDLGVSVNDLVTAFNSASTAVTYLGTDRATKLAKQFGDLNRETGNLGLTNSEAAQAVLEYTDMLRTVGSLQGKSNEDLIKGASEYVQELNQLSNITGKSRKDLQKEIEARRKNLDLNLAIAGLPKEVQDNVRKATDGFSVLGPTMADIFTKTMASELSGKGLAGLDSATQIMLTQSGLAEVMPRMADEMARTGKTSQTMGEALAKIASPEMLVRLRNMANGTGAVADAARTFLQGQQEAANALKRESDIHDEVNKRLTTYGNTLTESQIAEQVRAEFQKKSDDQAGEMLKTQQKLEASVNTLKAAFDTMVTRNIIPMLPAFQKLADVVTVVAEVFNRVGDDLSTGFGWIVKQSTWVGDQFKSLGDWVKSILIEFGVMKSPAADADSRGDHDRNRMGPGPESAFSSINVAKYATEAALGIYSGGKLVRGLGRLTGIGGKATEALSMANINPLSMAEGPGLSGVGNASRGVGGVLGKAGGALSGSIRGFGSIIGDAVTGTMDVIAKSSDSLKTIVKNIGGAIGGAAGDLLGGLFKGLSDGLSAVSPKALEGATIIAGTITILSGGIAVGGIALSSAISLIARSLPELMFGLKDLTHVDGDKLKNVGSGMEAVGVGLKEMGKAEVVDAFGNLLSKVFSLFGVKDDPIEKFKKFGELAEPLGKVAPVMKVFADSWTQALTALNGAKIDDSVTKTIENLSNILFVDNKAGFWSGKVTTASKVQELADSIGSLASRTAELQGNQAGSTPAGAKLLSPSDLQKRTINFYDDQKSSNAALINLLGMVNEKLDALHDTTSEGHKSTVSAIKNGDRLY